MSALVESLGPGSVLDERYQLEQVIGRGGMGTVFAAKHLELGEEVAVKVLQAGTGFATMEAEHLERFLREARLAAKIKNEHVVRIIDVARGKNGAPPYIVMERLHGMDLGELVEKSGRVAVPEAVEYVMQACEALAEAHALGIVHRDLKSSNLHCTSHGDGTFTIKVLDFGISKTHEDSAEVVLTSTSTVFGSPAYMSPEQIRSAKHVDHRTDVWAMGVVLYELITGHFPFHGETASAMLAAIAADMPFPLGQFGIAAPPAFEHALFSALAKPRDQRTTTIAAFAASIAPFGGQGAQESLVAIQRAITRSSSRGGSVNMAPVAPSSPQSSDVITGPMSDTVRVSDSQEVEASGNGRPQSQPSFGDASSPGRVAIARSDGVRATDREMVISSSPQPNPGTSIGAIIGFVGAGVALAVGVSAIGLYLYLRHLQPMPPAPPAAAATVTSAPALEPPPSASIAIPVASAPPVASSAVPAPAPAPPPRPRAKPQQAPHPAVSPVNSAKPNVSTPPQADQRL